MPTTPTPAPLRALLDKPYLDLFDLALRRPVAPAEAAALRTALERGREACTRRYKDQAKTFANQIERARKELKTRSSRLTEAERKQLHCRIATLELLRSEAQVLSREAIPIAYDNLLAKLELLEQWPPLERQIRQDLAAGRPTTRRWADVQDIGVRSIASDQEKDIPRGREAIEEMRRAGLLPPTLNSPAIQSYVNGLAQAIARHSDLKIPLHVTILDSKEANAFALPGGYLFIERGLLEAADDESELAGVLAHEIAHDAARHSAKLMKRALIAGIMYQAAQVAAVLLTGGIAGPGVYYALQYGFYGLGMVLDLRLLGISRDFEIEADQLGIQYAWASGYDPSGFIRFFDKMATRQGYINGVSWFRTHPPFFQRMTEAEREIRFLPSKPHLIVQSSRFEAMKQQLAPLAAAARQHEAEPPPSLLLPRQEGCAAPTRLEYQPGQPIESLCAAPARTGEVPAVAR